MIHNFLLICVLFCLLILKEPYNDYLFTFLMCVGFFRGNYVCLAPLFLSTSTASLLPPFIPFHIDKTFAFCLGIRGLGLKINRVSILFYIAVGAICVFLNKVKFEFIALPTLLYVSFVWPRNFGFISVFFSILFVSVEAGILVCLVVLHKWLKRSRPILLVLLIALLPIFHIFKNGSTLDQTFGIFSYFSFITILCLRRSPFSASLGLLGMIWGLVSVLFFLGVNRIVGRRWLTSLVLVLLLQTLVISATYPRFSESIRDTDLLSNSSLKRVVIKLDCDKLIKNQSKESMNNCRGLNVVAVRGVLD
ncbi:MAG: hypothetical protein NZO16_05055 [Deltaproteobacteria bacterium]|nr:hypothetical protein [Deltaproteobacteria bacterium]